MLAAAALGRDEAGADDGRAGDAESGCRRRGAIARGGQSAHGLLSRNCLRGRLGGSSRGTRLSRRHGRRARLTSTAWLRRRSRGGLGRGIGLRRGFGLGRIL